MAKCAWLIVADRPNIPMEIGTVVDRNQNGLGIDDLVTVSF